MQGFPARPIPLPGHLPLALALLLLLALQELAQFLGLAHIALGRPLVRLQQLRLVQRLQLLDLLLVLGDELLDLGLQPWGWWTGCAIRQAGTGLA